MTREDEMEYTEDMAWAQVKALSISFGDGDNNKTKWSELVLHKKLKHVQQIELYSPYMLKY